MKRISILALLLITCVFATLSFVSCGKGNGGNTHKHSFTVETATDKYLCSEATCTQKATYYYSCECGAKGTETFEYGNPKGHSFTNYKPNDDATCSGDGTKTATCDRCDATDVIPDVGSKLPHTYDAKWTSDDEYHWHKATCEHSTEVSGKAKHTAGEWIIDEAATYEKAGKRHKECEVCEKLLETEVIPQLEKDEIIFKTITFGEDKKANFKTSNGQTTFNIKDEISASGKSKFIVSKNADGSNPITGETVALECGDNVIYVIETVDGTTVNVYVIMIYRRFVYTITFNTNGGSDVANQQVEEDSLVILPPSPTKAGHTFDGWDYDFTKPVDGEVTINAKWTANTDTKYKVEYYLQNLDNDDYTLEETADLTGTTDTTANAEQKTFDHFVINIEISIVSGNIDGDGTLVLKIYYTRKTYNVKVDANNEKAGTIEGNTGDLKYGSTVTVKAVTKSGYTFDGWYNGETLVSIEISYSYVVSDGITLTAKWTANTDTKYKVEYYLQNLDKDDYTLEETANLTGTTDTTVNAEQKTFDHFVINIEISIVSGNIEGDGTLVLKIYYTRKTYEILIENDETSGTVTDISGTYKYGEKLTVKVESTNRGYIFDGWYNGETLLSAEEEYIFIVKKTVNITAKWAKDSSQGLKYTLSTDGTYYIVSGIGTCTDTDIVIPDTYENLPVTIIGGYAFQNGSGLTSITIPNTVTTIDERAFQNCSGLTSVIIGNSVTTIKMCAFSGCSKLTSIKLPNSITSIDEYAFSECGSLTSVTLPDTITTISKYMFKNCSGLTNMELPHTVTTIDYEAFKGCSGLTSIEIPNSVTTIETSAFQNCSGLTNIEIPNSVTTIYGHAFSGCSGLTSVTLPNSITTITVGMFKDCSRLTSIEIPDSVTTIGNYAFSGCSSLTNITIPNNVTIISAYVFFGCSSLTNINIHDSITTIEQQAFSGCSKLMDITIPDSVTSIGEYAFSGTAWYNNQPDGVVYAGKIVYEYKGTMPENSTIVIRDGMLSINSSVFYTCNGLISVEIPDSVTSIGSSAFYGCNELKNVKIGNGVISIGSSAFSNCTKLTEVTIPDSVTSIGVNAFYACSALTSVTIGNGVTSIAERAFKDCSNLVNVIWNAKNCKIAGSSKNPIFENCSITTVTFGNDVNTIPANALYSCWGLTNVIISDSVTTIGNSVFNNCSGLIVYYKGTAAEWTKISIKYGNTNLTNATRYYYSETEPALNEDGTEYDGNYWHYDTDGVTPVIWKKEN